MSRAMHNMPEEGSWFTEMVQMEILFGEGSEGGTNIISVPGYTWSAIAESLHWWIKHYHQLTRQAWDRGCGDRKEEGRVRSRFPWRKTNSNSLRTNQPCQLSAPSDIFGWPQRRHNISPVFSQSWWKPREWKVLVVITGITPDTWGVLHTFPKGYYFKKSHLNCLPN